MSANSTHYKIACGWIAVAFALRTIIAMFVPLLPDETYYWEWSRHLAAGYFDHPPAIALLVAAGTSLFGNTAFGVRVGPAIAALVAHASIVIVAGRVGGSRAAARAACLVALLPLATLGLVLATPDAPLLATTAFALLALERALSAAPGSKQSVSWWLITGVALGAAFLSKYTAVLMPASLVLACIVYAPLRKRFSDPGPWLASLVALAIFAPVVAWNAHTNWISFRFQFQHGLGVPVRGNALGRELELLGGQLGLATPIFGVMLFVAVLVAFRGEWRSRTTTEMTDRGVVRFAFAASAMMPLVVFGISALRRRVEPNWPALFYPAAMVLLSANTARWAEARWWKWGVGIAAGILAVLMLQTWRPVAPVAPAKDPVARAYGWTALAESVDAARGDGLLRGTTKQWVAAERYQDASELAFHLSGQPQVFALNLSGRANQYDLWDAPVDNIGENDGLVATFDASPAGDALAAIVSRWFEQSKRGDTVQLRRGAGIVAERRIWIFRNARAIPARQSPFVR